MSDHDHPPADQRLLDAAKAGCAESRILLNRRAFMGMSAGLFTWGFMPRCAEAAAASENGDPRLLIVQLRGGMDGLNVLVPIGDPQYEKKRGLLALPQANLLKLKDAQLKDRSDFALNANLTDFRAWFNSGEAAVVHAVAPPLQNRSHFDCQDNIDTGYGAVTAGSSADGWLGRYLRQTASFDSAGEVVSCTGAAAVNRMPLILKGAPKVDSWAPAAPPAFATDQVYESLVSLYGAEAPHLKTLLKNGKDTDAIVRDGAPRAFLNDLADSSKNVTSAFTAAGRLLGSDNGPRIGVLSIDSWDSHQLQDSALVSNLCLLNKSLAAFKLAVGSKWQNTVVVCVSEFGRSVAPNGSGSEHGVGTVALLAGGAVAGRKLHGDFPGLTTLEAEGGLKAGTDLRAVFKGILKDHLHARDADIAEAFPGSDRLSPLAGMIKQA